MNVREKLKRKKCIVISYCRDFIGGHDAIIDMTQHQWALYHSPSAPNIQVKKAGQYFHKYWIEAGLGGGGGAERRKK